MSNCVRIPKIIAFYKRCFANLEIIKKNKIKKFFLLTISLLVLIVGFSQKPANRMKNLILDEASFARLGQTRTPSDEDLFEQILFDDLPLIIDSQENRAYFTNSSYSDQPLQFNPLITFKSNEKLQVAFLDKELSWESIARNEATPFIVYTETKFQQFELVITTLPLVEIRLNEAPEDPDKPIPDDDVYGLMVVLDNQNTKSILNKVFQSDVVCHIRGASSRLYPQNSYRISLKYDSLGINERKNQKSLLGMDWDDDWILYAPFNDPEKIRNTLSTNLWWEWGAKNNDLGMVNGTQGKFVELFIDGRYWGIYTLMKPITASKLLMLGDEDPGKSEYYYRTLSYDGVSHEMFMNEPDFIPEDSTRATVGRYEIRYPKDPQPGYEKWALLDEFTQVLEGDYETFENEIFNMADEQNAIDLWLFIKTTMAFDNRGKNLNFVAKRVGGKYIFYFSPWDLDQTWGMIWTGASPFLTSVTRNPDDPVELYLIFERFILEGKSREVISKLQSRYSEVRNSILSDSAMEETLNGYEDDIFNSGAILRNRNRWPDASFSPNMDYFRSLVMERLHFMDYYIENLAELGLN